MGHGYKSNSLSDYILNVNGDTEINGNLYTKNINHCDKNNGFLIIGDKTRELSIRSSRNPDISALYLNNKLSSNVCLSANQGFCITPYYLSEHVNVSSIISGNIYYITNVESNVQAISCIIADKSNLLPLNVKGWLIRFLPGEDGQIVLLKNLYTVGIGDRSIDLYVQPLNCAIIGADRSTVYVKQGTISDAYNSASSRFFIYVKKYSAWIEFYCCN